VTVISVPTVVANKARIYGAQDWLDDLPDIISNLERSWGLRVGASFEDATEAFVCEVVLEDGTPAVLKVPIPRDEDSFRHEVTVLLLANGEGCAQLLRHEENPGVMLLERLGPNLRSLGLPLEQRLEILCSTVERLWRPAPESKLPTGREKAKWLDDFIATTWEALNHPCSEEAVDYAKRCVQRRIHSFDEERSVLVHGDVHEWNALVAKDGFKLVDPDGLLVEAEYDLGVMMREDPLELLSTDPFERARWLGARCALSAQTIWEWGVIERVSTGLLACQIDLQPLGRDMLRAAEYVSTLAEEP
jgi:streptomycin 6-kinase